MDILTPEKAPRYKRDNITSHLLASSLTCQSKHLTTSLVEMAPGGVQNLHSHMPEQTYFILEGSGSMTVGAQTGDVGVGDCVFIPSGTPHGLINTGDVPLKYYSAAGPSFPADKLEELWPLQSIAQEEGLSK